MPSKLSKLAKTRLTILRDYMTKVKDKNFDYDTILTGSLNSHAKPACGSTACTLGHAGCIPEFRKLGLKTSFKGDDLAPISLGIVVDELGVADLAKFFGISSQRVSYLFFNWDDGTGFYGEVTRQDAINRLNKVLNG